MFDRLTTIGTQYLGIAVDYLSRTEIWVQLVLIVVLFLPAVFLSWRVEPQLEERAQQIKRIPGLLRLIIAFLRRFEWVFFVLFLAAVYVVTDATGWQAHSVRGAISGTLKKKHGMIISSEAVSGRGRVYRIVNPT